jgi:hypothetical protein
MGKTCSEEVPTFSRWSAWNQRGDKMNWVDRELVVCDPALEDFWWSHQQLRSWGEVDVVISKQVLYGLRYSAMICALKMSSIHSRTSSVVLHFSPSRIKKSRRSPIFYLDGQRRRSRISPPIPNARSHLPLPPADLHAAQLPEPCLSGLLWSSLLQLWSSSLRRTSSKELRARRQTAMLGEIGGRRGGRPSGEEEERRCFDVRVAASGGFGRVSRRSDGGGTQGAEDLKKMGGEKRDASVWPWMLHVVMHSRLFADACDLALNVLSEYLLMHWWLLLWALRITSHQIYGGSTWWLRCRPSVQQYTWEVKSILDPACLGSVTICLKMQVGCPAAIRSVRDFIKQDKQVPTKQSKQSL